jgi:hypothetical protein
LSQCDLLIFVCGKCSMEAAITAGGPYYQVSRYDAGTVKASIGGDTMTFTVAAPRRDGLLLSYARIVERYAESKVEPVDR